MDPDSIELSNLSKSFEYTKMATELDRCDDRDELRNVAKAYLKLYLKQQEVIGRMGLNS